ncbi:hypothetical protein BUALT_Bualt06G0035200 [Buddleja alternifolia]|uniref:Major facilitator superfamily (MFS) profile domain-containing protein n=1 Tax=Buddleja alternifolia TaxID=168488 RepID=A0AAV6XJC8_9LAMI|nr:hypothetical protein BUALT_Bualt06G0035200 [Buddleja alternifolia]
MRELRPLVHLLLPLCVHWIAEEMTVSVLVDVTTNALCPGQMTCPQAIYINGVQQTVVGIFKMIVLPLLGQLADERGRKPLLLLTLSTTIVPFTLLAINQSEGSVYAYYVLRTVSYIISQGSIFCIAVAYAADVVDEGKRAAAFSWITGLFSASHVIGNFLARFLPEDYIFEVSIALLIFVPVYMSLFLKETVRPTQKQDQHIPFLNNAFKIIKNRYYSMKNAAGVVTSSSTLKRISLVSFFYELGMSGISSVLLCLSGSSIAYFNYLISWSLNRIFQDAGTSSSQSIGWRETDPLCSLACVNSIWSALWLGLGTMGMYTGMLNPRLHACFFYLLFWGSSFHLESHAQLLKKAVPYLSASFGVIYVLVKPSTYAVISKAANSADQVISLCFACTLKIEDAPSNKNLEDKIEDIETPLLS